MSRMRPWGPVPGTRTSMRGLPFPAPPNGGASPTRPRPAEGIAALRDALMAERERLSGEILYIDTESLPRARETALNAAVLAESRRTEMAVQRALALGGKVEAMLARKAGLQADLGAVKERLCDALVRLADAERDGRSR